MSSVRPPGAGYLYLAACDAPDLAQLSMHVRDLTATSLHRRDNVARAKLHAIAAAHALSPSPPPPRRTPKPTRVCHDRHVDNDDDASTKDEAQSVQEEPASTSPSQKRIDALTRRLSQLLPSPGLSIVANSKAAAEVPRTPETSARELSEDGTFRPFLESIPPSPSLVELQTPLASPHKLLHRRNEPSLSASPAPRSLPPSPAAGAKSAQQDSVVSTLSVEIDVLSPTFASKRMQPELQAIKAGATAFQFISTRVDARVDSPPEFVASKLSLPYLLPPRLDREATLQGTNTSTMVMSLALAASSAGGVSAAVSSPTAPRSRTSPGTSFTASASPRVRRSAIVGASPVSVPTMVPVPSPLPPPPPPDTMASIAKRIATSAAEAAALTEKKAQIAPCLFDATSGSNAAARESYQDIVEIKMFNAGVHAVHDAATLATVARFLRACELHLDAPSAERQTVRSKVGACH